MRHALIATLAVLALSDAAVARPLTAEENTLFRQGGMLDAIQGQCDDYGMAVTLTPKGEAAWQGLSRIAFGETPTSNAALKAWRSGSQRFHQMIDDNRGDELAVCMAAKLAPGLQGMFTD